MSGPPAAADLAGVGRPPQVVDVMRRYLQQIACVLRPGSVRNTDQALRSFAGFLLERAPDVTTVNQVTRRHIEDYKPWLAARPGQNKARVTTATLAHRLGTLRMFFVRIDEWGWDQAPPRVPMFPGDLPRQDHPLSKALDDAAAAQLLRAAYNDQRLLVGVTVKVLLRTGLRVSEFTALPADAVVHIGAGPWLHVPVGKLREDRYLPLHPQLVELIDTYRTAHVSPSNPWLLPRENGRALDRHTVTRLLNRAGASAGLTHIHPHQLRHTLATQAINRGMSLEAIAAMLGHRFGHDPALRQDRQPHRRRRVLRRHRRPLRPGPPAARRHHRTQDGPAPPRTPPTPRDRYCTRPPELDCAFENTCETCTFFQTSIEFRPTLQAQHDDATSKGQHHRADLFGKLLTNLTDSDAS